MTVALSPIRFSLWMSKTLEVNLIQSSLVAVDTLGASVGQMALIATDPKLLLLDEVIAGLTYGEIEQISKLLVKRKETHGTTYMIVSHDLKSLAPFVDRVIVIHDGSVLMQGTFDEVVGDPQVQDAYLGTGGGEAQ